MRPIRFKGYTLMVDRWGLTIFHYIDNDRINHETWSIYWSCLPKVHYRQTNW